ncbi:hypothetical protein BKM03_05925 [Pseudomonas avellanae]|uniref:Uncharacterized protein n=1 Tax=Pseudomonas avellanae TaxID=46257 RepID=A0AAD0GM39_9PSED|nr:hypothetical protein BKM03_05925 [Pseudomonas avellanae]POP79713.1 hypothetical protein CXB34_26225 [Pseudomonas amygdali pv. morsprunorum]
MAVGLQPEAFVRALSIMTPSLKALTDQTAEITS